MQVLYIPAFSTNNSRETYFLSAGMKMKFLCCCYHGWLNENTMEQEIKVCQPPGRHWERCKPRERWEIPGTLLTPETTGTSKTRGTLEIPGTTDTLRTSGTLGTLGMLGSWEPR